MAPQLPDRETAWNQPDHVRQIGQAVDTLAGEGQRRVYVVGFSKGGRAAFQLATRLACKAVLTIDASPMTDDAGAVASEISQCVLPFWAICTSYSPDHRLERISRMHQAMVADEHIRSKEMVAPEAGTRCKSVIHLDEVAPDARHGALCTAVTSSRAPYEWLLKH